MKYPVDVQSEVLEKLLHMGRHTEWGARFGYRELKNSADFKNRVPLQGYEDLKPFVDRLKKGEQNLLWPTDISWFAKSSGTTSDKSKCIPVSKEALEECHFKSG